jgi:GAF domain-containing protein/HAMP domain-containing protein
MRRLNFIHWPISTKLTVIFLLAVLLPGLLIVVPFSIQRQNTLLRGQNEIRLETLGPYQIAQTELAIHNLQTELERFATEPTDYQDLERFLYLMRWSSIADDTRADLQTFIEGKIRGILRLAPSLSRIRLYDADRNLLLDVTTPPDGPRFNYERAAQEAITPANLLIQRGEVGLNTTLTEIYLDSAGQPSVDIIYTLRPAFDPTGVASIVGQMVFTQNLARAADDPTLPDVYASFRDFPQSEQATSIFALNSEGRLVTPAANLAWLYSASSSQGFRAAQRGETAVATYYSPLLKADVLGYYTSAQFTDGPQLIYLIETPMSEINREAAQEGLIALLWTGLGTLGLGIISILLGTLVIARPLARLTENARQITAGRLDRPLSRLDRRDEIGILNNTLGDMADQLLTAIHELETRVAERTRNLELTLEIGRVLTQIRDLDILLEEVVNLILSRFKKVYHVQVFLIDPQTRRANLRASTGAAGRKLLQRGHYLEVGSQSVIGTVTAAGEAVVALDTSHSPVHKRNEFLPDTRAEMALPLRIGSRIIGALDLQSTQPDAFDKQDVELFQGMADQITVAIDNAILLDESNARLYEIERLNRSLTETAWREIAQQRGAQRLSAASGQTAPAAQDWTPLQLEAMRARQIAERVEGDLVVFAVPILLREQIMGAVEWQVARERYTHDIRQTAQDLSARLALAAENIRLFEQSLQAAQREQLVNQISSQLIGSTDIDLILQTAVRELGLALRASQTMIRLAPPSPDDGDQHPPASEET